MHARHKLLAVGFTAASLALPLSAQARVDVDINIAPPPPRYEVVPRPRVGFVWAPGYWVWDGRHHRHVWRRGYYIRERHGQHWVPHQWVDRNGRWHYAPGHWER
ncbi:MAG: hypothetical protein ABI900_03830 [Betaproteobacteria bacterium]